MTVSARRCQPGLPAIAVSAAEAAIDRGKKSDRDERLAAALRENLKRRKAQARAVADAPTVAETGPSDGAADGR